MTILNASIERATQMLPALHKLQVETQELLAQLYTLAHSESGDASPIVTRVEAVERGLKTYFTGRPCAHGHVAERHTHNSNCAECGRIANRERAREVARFRKEWRAQQRVKP